MRANLFDSLLSNPNFPNDIAAALGERSACLQTVAASSAALQLLQGLHERSVPCMALQQGCMPVVIDVTAALT